MYRLLEVGEVIESGDEWWDSGEWRANNVVGLTYCVDIPLRRLVKPAVTPAASSVPDQVVSVGDRVAVLSGPWAGCTGVVTGFETEVSLSGYGRMTALRDSVPVVELDHVYVGGQRLNVKAGSIEKLPPVVSEVLHRDLAIGEVIRQGDEFWEFGYGPWTVAGPNEIGGTINTFKARHRRPVRIQSAGWRYLDAGETIAQGDQWVQNGHAWGVASAVGEKAEPITETGNVKIRRKLPANQGG